MNFWYRKPDAREFVENMEEWCEQCLEKPIDAGPIYQKGTCVIHR